MLKIVIIAILAATITAKPKMKPMGNPNAMGGPSEENCQEMYEHVTGEEYSDDSQTCMDQVKAKCETLNTDSMTAEEIKAAVDENKFGPWVVPCHLDNMMDSGKTPEDACLFLAEMEGVSDQISGTCVDYAIGQCEELSESDIENFEEEDKPIAFICHHLMVMSNKGDDLGLHDKLNSRKMPSNAGPPAAGGPTEEKCEKMYKMVNGEDYSGDSCMEEVKAKCSKLDPDTMTTDDIKAAVADEEFGPWVVPCHLHAMREHGKTPEDACRFLAKDNGVTDADIDAVGTCVEFALEKCEELTPEDVDEARDQEKPIPFICHHLKVMYEKGDMIGLEDAFKGNEPSGVLANGVRRSGIKKAKGNGPPHQGSLPSEGDPELEGHCQEMYEQVTGEAFSGDSCVEEVKEKCETLEPSSMDTEEIQAQVDQNNFGPWVVPCHMHHMKEEGKTPVDACLYLADKMGISSEVDADTCIDYAISKCQSLTEADIQAYKDDEMPVPFICHHLMHMSNKKAGQNTAERRRVLMKLIRKYLEE